MTNPSNETSQAPRDQDVTDAVGDPDPFDHEFFRAPLVAVHVPDAVCALEDEEDGWDPLVRRKMTPAVRARRARLARYVVAVVAGALVLCAQAFAAQARGHRTHPSFEKSAMRSMQSAP